MTEGDTASIVVEVSSSDYEFDFMVTLTDMEGTAVGVYFLLVQVQ